MPANPHHPQVGNLQISANAKTFGKQAPVNMTAIVNTSDTASPRLARWSASIALQHFHVPQRT
jgi:hypothetical protein